jgi:adenylosuccinate synthase
MPLDIIIGTQWGDEGKGRFVDLLSQHADLVARFNGGDNAGHTVTVGQQIYKLHLIPSGIIHPNTRNLMGNGMVIYPGALLEEMRMLEEAGVEVSPGRLAISHAAHMLTPAHRALDAARETARGADQLGTTGRGIGPAYTDKAARQGLRMVDLLDVKGMADKLEVQLRDTNQLLQTIYQGEPLDTQKVIREFLQYAQQLQPYIKDTGKLAADALAEGKTILGEGAQGSLLDLDLGTYPYVTSSSCTAASALLGLGIGIRPVRRVIGVTKAFQTRVGSGPFPTEQSGEAAENLRGSGANPWDEFGTTTGRPRRVGWLDGVLLRYAVRANGLTELAVTKLDILSGFSTLRICNAYLKDGQRYDTPPFGPTNLEKFQPEYQDLPGWSEDIGSARRWDELPQTAQAYIQSIAKISGVPVKWVSVGPERDQVIELEG